jgi:MFS family permease
MLVAGLSVGVVLGELRDQFHISGVVAALHGSTFGIGLLVAGVWGVRVVDRIGRRAALQLATASIAVGVILLCLGPAWPITLLGTALSGAGGALLVMVMPGLISDHHGEHRATAFAAVNGAPGLAGLVFSLIIGATLAAGLSWRPPYLIITACFTIALAVVAWPVAVPEGRREGTFSLAPFRERAVLVPWLHIVNAVLCEFTVGIWAVTYLHEVGRAGPGAAAVLASVFGVTMFLARMLLPRLLDRFGDATTSVSFVVIGSGALVMCLAPGLPAKVVGLTIVGLGGGPLYPLTVDAFYAKAGGRLDSVGMGAYCALASGAAVTAGPLFLGIMADTVSLRWALLVVPLLAVVGAVTQRPRARARTVSSY